jgi:hypothetical protein
VEFQDRMAERGADVRLVTAIEHTQLFKIREYSEWRVAVPSVANCLKVEFGAIYAGMRFLSFRDTITKGRFSARTPEQTKAATSSPRRRSPAQPFKARGGKRSASPLLSASYTRRQSGFFIVLNWGIG